MIIKKMTIGQEGSHMIEEAAAFARQAHAGAVRKGTNIPYITHPMETAVIVSLMKDDEEMIAAAMLHDVIEDAGVTPEELEERFGSRVTELVLFETEDKTGTWSERKSATIARLKGASRENKILTLGDKLSNLRSTARDYLIVGEDIWLRFNEKDKSRHGWYYGGVLAELGELKSYPAYQEYMLLYHKVFGK